MTSLLPYPYLLRSEFCKMQSPTTNMERYLEHSLNPWDLETRVLIFNLSLHCGPLASSASREQTHTKILSLFFHFNQIQFIKTQVLPLSIKMLQMIFWRQVMSKLHNMFNWISRLISPFLYPLLLSHISELKERKIETGQGRNQSLRSIFLLLSMWLK